MGPPTLSTTAGHWMRRGLWAIAGLLLILKVVQTDAAPATVLGWATVLAAAALVVFLPFAGTAWPWLDSWRTALVLVGLWSLPQVYPLLGGDGVEYYVLLRSPLIDHDLSLANDFEGFSYKPILTARGEPATRVQIGTALLWAPLVVATHVGVRFADALGARIPADGFAPIYQTAATTSTFLYGFAALILLEGSLRTLYGPALAALTVLGLYLATPLHFYLVANPFMSHGVSVFAATLFLLGWLRARESQRPRDWLLAGAAGGLMCLIRGHDSVLLLVPLLDLVSRPALGKRARLLATFLAVPALLALLQAAVWVRLYGLGFVGELASINLIGGFTPHPAELLFSPRHGLFTWTPLYLAAVLGWIGWLRRDARLAVLLALGFVLAVGLNSLFGDWWGSQAFGQRRLLSLTPLFALGLAETLHILVRRPLLPIALGLSAVVLWNLQFEYIYNSDLAGSKRDPVSLGVLVEAQEDVLYRRVLGWADRMPRGIWVLLYDNVKGVWLDEGPRSLAGRVVLGANPQPLSFLVGQGWYRPEAEEGTVFRRSRGGHSALNVPIKTPGDFHAILTARAELLEAPVGLDLEVNGEAVGHAELVPGWHSYAFEVPERVVQPGINSFVFRYSETPRGLDPVAHRKNAVLAVQSFRLDRLGDRPP